MNKKSSIMNKKPKTLQELFTDESKWTQNWSAKTKTGSATRSDSRAAVCWCLCGSIAKCYPKTKWPTISSKIANELKRRGVAKSPYAWYAVNTWNDDPRRTFAQVRKLIEKLDI